MDTRSKKWTNTILVTFVIIVMTLSGMYGISTIHNMALTGNSSFTVDELDQIDYIKKTQTSLFDKWAEQQGAKTYSGQQNHVSEDLLTKIKNESRVKVTMKVKPYDKKMTTTTSYYGAKNADYTGGRIEHFHIERSETELNKDGSFKGWDPTDDFNANPEEYYAFAGDSYTMEFVFPSNLLINNKKKQRLETAEIEISLTKKALTEIDQFQKKATKQLATGLKAIVIVSVVEVIGTILLCILFALQKKRTKFFNALDKIWWEIILAAGLILIGLAIALCIGDWQYTIEYAQGTMMSLSSSTLEMIMMLSYLSVPFFIMAFAVCVQTTVWRIKERNLLDSTFCLGYFRKWYRHEKQRRELEEEAMSFAQKHARDRIRQYRVLRYIMIGGVAVCVIILFTGAQLSDFLVTLIAITCISLFKFFKKYSNKYAEEQRDLGKLVDQIERISNGELTAITDISEDSDYYEYRVLRYIMIGGVAVCVIILFTGAQLSDFLVTLIAITCISLFKFFKKYSNKYAEEQRDLGKLVDQIERISNGELTAITDISEDSDYYEYSQKLTHIGQGMEKALETQMKGERMKIDLITNVSHDLKTPLTSIIGYVDLLSRDDTLSDEAKDYVTILVKKTERLKDIISDLFELAKSTSGDIKVDMEEMDMKRLVEQTLGDMADQIEESGFGIRYQCNTEHTKFMGDGNRMYRVVQNVIENALKYSLKGTRIFIYITEEAGNIVLKVTNTASYEMNFTEEEIMERFARAEKSRTSEGNGLGLSIADSFTKNCGGKFEIKIEGDQFTVTIQFKQYFKENN